MTRNHPPPSPFPSRGEGMRDSPSPLEGESRDGVYLKNAEAIYERSFAIIRAEADLSRFNRCDGGGGPARDSCLRRSGHRVRSRLFAYAADVGSEALMKRATVLVDASMVAHGIVPVHLPVSNPRRLHPARSARRAPRQAVGDDAFGRRGGSLGRMAEGRRGRHRQTRRRPCSICSSGSRTARPSRP